MFTNIKGTKNSGTLQNVITTVLVALLLLYVVVGVLHMDLDKQQPFMPNGISGVFNALISIAAVIFIKTAVLFVGSGILSWTELIPEVTGTPMIDTAVHMGGAIGGYLFAFVGILAPLSSINTAVMSSSRTSFAMARDQRLPSLFKTTNKNVIAVAIRDLEHISTVISNFSLTGYSLVNLAISDRSVLLIAVSVIRVGAFGLLSDYAETQIRFQGYFQGGYSENQRI